MKLRNRIVKSTFYTDPDLCRWDRDKRAFYQSLWACAEDSCCLEDDMFGVKIAAWPSPMDSDMSVERFEQWRDELVADGKLVPYEVSGKRYLFVPGMAAHEAPRNPQRPDCDLPPWVRWVANDKDPRKGSYEIDEPSTCGDVVQALYNDSTSVLQASPSRPAPPCPALSRPDPNCLSLRPSQVDTDPAMPESGTQVDLSISESERQDLIERFGEDNATALLEAVRLDAENGKAVRSWYALAVKYGDWRIRQGQMSKPRRAKAECSNPECCNGWVLDDHGTKRCPDCTQTAKEKP